MDFFTSLISVGLLIALAIPGFILKKLKMLPSGAVQTLVVLLMYVSQPFLTVSSFAQKTYESRLLVNMGLVFAFSFVLQFIVFFICKAAFSFSKREAEKKVCVAAGFMSNCAFMGIPLMQAFYPGSSEPIIYCAIFIVSFNILSWTLSVYQMTGDKKFISLKKAFLNPPTIALAVALPIFFTGFALPSSVLNSIRFLGDMTSPLSMIILGIRLAEIDFKRLFSTLNVYIASALKLIVSPLVSLGILILVRLIYPLDSLIIISLYIIMAMPTANSAILFAELFGGDSDTAVKCTLLTTVFCVVTVPLLMLVCNFL